MPVIRCRKRCGNSWGGCRSRRPSKQFWKIFLRHGWTRKDSSNATCQLASAHPVETSCIAMELYERLRTPLYADPFATLFELSTLDSASTRSAHALAMFGDWFQG